jgi:hypothetical protein
VEFKKLDRLAPGNEAPTSVIGRMVKVHATPEGSPWMWTLAFGHPTWVAPPKPEDDSATPNPPRATIYRPQHWNAY